MYSPTIYEGGKGVEKYFDARCEKGKKEFVPPT